LIARFAVTCCACCFPSPHSRDSYEQNTSAISLRIRTYAYANIHTHMHTCIHKPTRTGILPHTRASKITHLHADTNIHPHLHTHTHTHTHTQNWLTHNVFSCKLLCFTLTYPSLQLMVSFTFIKHQKTRPYTPNTHTHTHRFI
jgi:hypothetical protein